MIMYVRGGFRPQIHLVTNLPKNVGHHGWPTRKILNSRLPEMALNTLKNALYLLSTGKNSTLLHYRILNPSLYL